MKLNTGAIRWRGTSLYLDYRAGDRRVRELFARLVTSSPSERRNLEKDARLALAEKQAAARRGFFEIKNEYPTYRQMASHYWDFCQSKKPYMADSCCRGSEWKKLIVGIEHFGPKKADEIQREDIKAFRMAIRADKPSWSSATVNRVVSKVGQVYHWCINQEVWSSAGAPEREAFAYGKIERCIRLTYPCRGLLKLRESTGRGTIPTIEQFKALLEKLPAEIYRHVAVLAASTGLRRRNVLGLTWDEVDLIAGTIRIRGHKGGTEPTIKALHADAKAVLWSRIEGAADGAQVFGSGLSGLNKAWREARAAAGLPGLQFKHLRTAYASWRVEEGVPLGLLQRQLDHSTPATTGKHYNLADVAGTEIVGKQRSIL